MDCQPNIQEEEKKEHPLHIFNQEEHAKGYARKYLFKQVLSQQEKTTLATQPLLV